MVYLKYKVQYLLILTICLGFSNGEECSKNEFECADGEECILRSDVCNDFPDCFDDSDEDEEFCKEWAHEVTDDTDYGNYEDESFEEAEETEEEDDFWDTDFGGFDVFEDPSFGSPTLVEGEYDDCMLEKCVASGILSFYSGREYVYHYDVTTDTEATNSKKSVSQKSSVKLDADVRLRVFSPCEMEIQIENMKATASSKSRGDDEHIELDNAFKQSVEKHSMRFSMMNGAVKTVCPSPDEESRSLNFKRGIISLFQNTMAKIHLKHKTLETDVLGTCPTEYNFKPGFTGPRAVVSKSKDLNSCSGRSKIWSSAKGVLYMFPGSNDNIPIIDSSLSCEQEIQGMVMKSTCNEKHLLNPLTTNSSSVHTSIRQVLDFVQKEDLFTSRGLVERRTGIAFNHYFAQENNLDDESENSEWKNEELVKIIEDILNLITEEPSITEYGTPAKMLSHLVHSLRQINYESIKQLFEERPWGEKDKDFFYDALPMAGTAGTVSFMADIIATLEPQRIEEWSASFGSIKNPDIQTIQASTKLLGLPISMDMMLHLGSLIHSYCLDHSSCGYHEPVQELLSAMEDGITTYNEKPEVLLSLKGLGNAGIAFTSMPNVLQDILSRDKTDIDVLIVAIDSIRRLPCNISRSLLEEIFIDASKDSEVRIMSYLSIMQCANYRTVKSVYEVLEKEEVNQVGSFVWTHLENLKETSSPTKVEIQGLLSNKKLNRKFKSDFRKYSKNIELSGFYDKLNVGGSFESNIIFSQSSWVPRSIGLNLTADLFGRSFNFLEMNSRMEGFDSLFKRFLWSKIWHNSRPGTSNIKNNKIQDLIAQQTDEAGSEFETGVKLSLNMKTFGNDVYYKSFDEKRISEDFTKNIRPEILMEQIVRGKTFKLNHSWLPLDSSLQLATSSGLPLVLEIEGSAVVDVSARIQAVIMGPNKNFGGHLTPTLSLNARASMSIDSGYFKSGAEVDANVHSTTAIDGQIKVDEENEIMMDLNIPKKSLNILHVESSLNLIHAAADPLEDESKKEVVTDSSQDLKKHKSCSPMEQELGVSLCWLLSYPSIGEDPMSLGILSKGPIVFNLQLDKIDPSMTGYNFHYRYKSDPSLMNFLLKFDIKGIEKSRERSIHFIIDQESRELYLLFKTPQYYIQSKGTFQWSSSFKKLSAEVTLNNNPISTIEASYKTHDKKGQAIKQPSLKVTYKGKEVIKLLGDLEQKSKTSSESEYKSYTSVNLVYDVNLGQTARGQIWGTINSEDFNNWETNLRSRYTLRGKEETVVFEYNERLREDGGLLKTDKRWKLETSEFKYINTKGKWSTKQNWGVFENSAQLSFGEHFEDPAHQVDFYTSRVIEDSAVSNNYNVTIGIKYPKNNLDAIIGADFLRENKDITTGFIIQLSSGKPLMSRFHLKRNRVVPHEVEVGLECKIFNWADFSILGKSNQVKTNSYEFEILATAMQKLMQIEIIGSYTDKRTNIRKEHALDLKIVRPNEDLIIINTSVFKDTKEIGGLMRVRVRASNWKVRLVYLTNTDDLQAKQRKLELDLNIPSGIYFWHADITYGDFITISNHIHIRSRDIGLRLELQPNGTNGRRSLTTVLKWDLNRDPNKRASLKLAYERDAFEFEVSARKSFLGENCGIRWNSKKTYEFLYEESTWVHQHNGEVFWIDEKLVNNQILFRGDMHLKRGIGAIFSSNLLITTPFEGWKENSANIVYSRDSNHILASLHSHWHHNEFLNMSAEVGRQLDEGETRLVSKLDLLSSFEGMVSLSSAAVLKLLDKSIIGNVFIQWEDDRVETAVELINESGPNEIRGSLSGQILTSLAGYQHLSIYIDLGLTTKYILLHATAKWLDTLYEMRCRGDLMTAEDYVNGEITLTTPQFGPDAGVAKFRVYSDPRDDTETLELDCRWLGKSINLNGKLHRKRGPFGGQLTLTTPFEKLPHAALILGHSNHMQDFSTKTEALVIFNHTQNFGFELASHLASKTDFLIKMALVTPHKKFKEIRAEIRNKYIHAENTTVFSKIFGQINDKKYGLGGRYEQGESPLLRVGLEFYSPLPALSEIVLDLADNSTEETVRYNLHVKQGRRREIKVNTEFTDVPDLVECKVNSKILWHGKYNIDVDLDASGKYERAYHKRISYSIQSVSKTDIYKISGDGSQAPDGSVAAQVDFKHPKIPFTKLVCNYMKFIPDDDHEGYLNAELFQDTTLLGNFNHKETDNGARAYFSLPLYNISEGEFSYSKDRLDLERMGVNVMLRVGDEQGRIDANVKVDSRGYAKEIDGKLESTIERFDDLRLLVEGHLDGGKYTATYTLEGSSETSVKGLFEMKFVNYESFGLLFEAEIYDNDKKIDDYFANIQFENTHPSNRRLMVKLNAPDNEYSVDFKLRNSEYPYTLGIEWNLPSSGVNFELTLKDLSRKRIKSSVKLNLEFEDFPLMKFGVDVDLINNSSLDGVDLGMNLKLESNLDTLNLVTLEGKLRQVTSEPGELSVKIKVPGMNPIHLSANATQLTDPFDLRVTITLDLYTGIYGFVGHVRKSPILIGIDGEIWWSIASTKVENVAFITRLTLSGAPSLDNRGVNGTITLKIPMLPGFEMSTVNVDITKKGKKIDFILSTRVKGHLHTLEGTYEGTMLDGMSETKGEIILTSDVIKMGHPIYVTYEVFNGRTEFKGKLNVDWPSRNRKTKEFERNAVNFNIDHKSLSKYHHEGNIDLRYGDLPAVFSYAFEFPPDSEYVLVKIGVLVKRIVIEFKFERKETSMKKGHLARTTTFEFTNPLWPFGIASVKEQTVMEISTQVQDKISIYDLWNKNKEMSIALTRSKGNGEGRIKMEGSVMKRVIEAAAGYKMKPDNVGVDFLFAWSPKETIKAELEWIDKSKSTEGRNQVIARVSHPLREVLLVGAYDLTSKGLFTDIIFNWDVKNKDKQPLKIVGELEKISYLPRDKHFRCFYVLSHPALMTDVTVTGEYKRDEFLSPLRLDLILSYSNVPANDFKINLDLDKKKGERRFTNAFSIKHLSSNLHIWMKGEISLKYPNYFMKQKFVNENRRRADESLSVESELNLDTKNFSLDVDGKEKLFSISGKSSQTRDTWEVLTMLNNENEATSSSLSITQSDNPEFIFIMDGFGSKPTEKFETIAEPSSIPQIQAETPRYAATKIILEGKVINRRLVTASLRHLLPVNLNQSSNGEGEITRLEEETWVQDGDFTLKLNHSRLLFTKLSWRKEAEQEIVNELYNLVGLTKELRENLREVVKEYVKNFLGEAIGKVHLVKNDLLMVSTPLVDDFRNESKIFRHELIAFFQNLNMTKDEIKYKKSMKYIISSFNKTIQSIPYVRKLKSRMGKSGLLSSTIQRIKIKIRAILTSLLDRSSDSKGSPSALKQMYISFMDSYDQVVKQWYRSFRMTLNQFRLTVRQWLRDRWYSVYYNYKPHIFETQYIVESALKNIFTKVSGRMREFGQNISSMSYFQSLQAFYQQSKKIYDDISSRSVKQNMEEFLDYTTAKIKEGMRAFSSNVIPFLDDWIAELQKAWKILQSYEGVKAMAKFVVDVYKTTLNLLLEIDFKDLLLDIVSFTYENGRTIISQSAIEAQFRNIRSKTEFDWFPERGTIKLVQKLPFEWMELDDKPKYQEMFVVPALSAIRNALSTATEASILDSWFKYFNFNYQIYTWIPPFEATGIIIGDDHMLTFDGKLLTYSGSCEHLLAADLILKNWAFTIKYNKNAKKVINIYVDGVLVELSMDYKVKVDKKRVVLPYNSENTSFDILRSGGVIEVRDGYHSLKWNVPHDVVTIMFPGFTFMNTIGVLGNNNYEPWDDLRSPDGRTFRVSEMKAFMDSWDVSRKPCVSVQNVLPQVQDSSITIKGPSRFSCDTLFRNKKLSPFKYCFYQVNPEPYYSMCMDKMTKSSDYCSTSMAYSRMCYEAGVPIKLPYTCVQCEYRKATENGTRYLDEGGMVEFTKDEVEPTMDVVLIYEAAQCNKDKLHSTQMDKFLYSFDKVLRKSEGIKNIRYSIYGYGNPIMDSSYDVFTTAREAIKSLRRSQYTEMLNRDDHSFDAIRKVSSMSFDGPAAITFLLFPCQPCQETDQLDYSTMLHILKNNRASLHVIQDEDFGIMKKKLKSEVIGISHEERAFQITDFKRKDRNDMGSTSLYNQVRLPKSELGACYALAFGSNGTIWTSSSLRSKRKIIATRFGAVVAKNVVKYPDANYKCLCRSTDAVTPLFTCDTWVQTEDRNDLEVINFGGTIGDISISENPGFYRDTISNTVM